MFAIQNKISSPAVEQVVEATIYLSGVGAESGGLAAAHAVNNGMSEVPDLHMTQHGEKVVFGLLTQLVLENAPKDEIESVIGVIKAAGLPMTLSELGLKTFREEEWRKVAKVACDKNDTMCNLPFSVTEDDVYNAMVTANTMAEYYRKH